MHLQVARLCLDCGEVHAEPHCPVCASEAFGYLTRWVPAPERRIRPRPATSPEADVYRELISPKAPEPRLGRLLTRSTLGVTAIAAAGWLWRWNSHRTRDEQERTTNAAPATGDREPDDARG